MRPKAGKHALSSGDDISTKKRPHRLFLGARKMTQSASSIDTGNSIDILVGMQLTRPNDTTLAHEKT